MGYYDIDDILVDSTEVPCKYLENNPGKPIRKNTKLSLPLWLARVLAIVGADSQEQEDMDPNTEEEDGVINAIKTDPKSLDLHAINPYFLDMALKWIALYSDKDLGEIVYELLLERAQQINNYASSVSIDTEYGNKYRSALLDALRLQQNSANEDRSGPLASINGTSSLTTRSANNSGIGSSVGTSQATNLAASTRFLLKLDEFERQLYKDTHDSYRDTKKWVSK
ncbi:DNA replication complex GINS protein PSF3 [Nakaseomyces glabratus]|nr:DNA replication complex GINS protein PSF3 [Nakaseomyces glabratus]SLM12456.1 DNA replication complex GINS protein PSF3 [Nakaseomyces glabratus]